MSDHMVAAAVHGLQGDHRWKSSSAGVVKINMDAAVPMDDGLGLGYVARDHKGRQHDINIALL